MKKLLVLFSVVVAMASCKGKQDDNTQVLGAKSEKEYEEFKAWKAEKERAAAAKTHTTVVYKEAPAAPRPKGWSKAAKGAVIGGAAGAVGGAIIAKKNPAAGAVVGAAVGAGTGYAIGRAEDKKDGRVPARR